MQTIKGSQRYERSGGEVAGETQGAVCRLQHRKSMLITR